MSTCSLGCATALACAAATVAACTSPEPVLATNPTWVDPITELIRIEWNEPVDCAFGGGHGCLRSVPFTVERLTCDGGVLGVLGVGGTFVRPRGATS